MPNLRDLCKKINIRTPLLFDEPMFDHTSFKIGGSADIFATPSNEDECANLLGFCMKERIPYFLLGAGSNILVSDDGIEGMVIDLGKLSRIEINDTTVSAQSGATVSSVCEAALAHSLSGLEFIYSMPGTIGGAIWMNARCYGVSVSDVVESVEFIDEDLKLRTIKTDPSLFGYKKSPFQKLHGMILRGSFVLRKGEKEKILAEMEAKKKDRETKGHFIAPSAGSVFKNNRDFGKSTGEILDSLGMKGYAIGGAKVSPLHANIIINNGKASASDVLRLMRHMEEAVKNAFGFELEREVLLVGRWQ